MSSFTPPPDGAQGQPYPPQPGQPFPPQPGQFPPQQGQPFPPQPGQPFPPQPGQPFPPQPAQGMPPQPGQPFPGQPYPQGYAPAPQRNQLLWIASLLMIIGAGVLLLFALLLIAGAAALSSQYSGAEIGLLWAVILVLLVGIAFQLFIGIQGIKNAANPHKGDFLFKMGCVVVGIQLVGVIVNSVSSGFNAWTAIVGLALPILFTYGAYQLKNQLH